MLINRLLKGGAKVSLTKPEAGGVPNVIATARPDVWSKAIEDFEIQPDRKQNAAAPERRCWPPRSTAAQSASTSRTIPPWTKAGPASCSIEYGFNYTKLHNAEIKAGQPAPANSTPSSFPISAQLPSRRPRLQDHRPRVSRRHRRHRPGRAAPVSWPKAARWWRWARLPTCWWTSCRWA